VATITRTALIDDLDGSDADQSVTLTVDGKRYQVDLSKANFEEWIAPLVKAVSPSCPTHHEEAEVDEAGNRQAHDEGHRLRTAERQGPERRAGVPEAARRSDRRRGRQGVEDSGHTKD